MARGEKSHLIDQYLTENLTVSQIIEKVSSAFPDYDKFKIKNLIAVRRCHQKKKIEQNNQTISIN